MAKISVIIIALNEEENIADCLKSVYWADEIIVIVDSRCIDNTSNIALKYTDKVYTVDWMGYAETKEFALEKTNGDWVFWIDADERVTKELEVEIKQIITQTNNVDGFLVPRKAYFLGRWIKHCGWYPGYVMRLVKKDLAKFKKSNVHESFEFNGVSKKLKHDLIHYTDLNIEHYFHKYNNYTSLAIKDMVKKKKKFKLKALLFRPIYAFIKMYFLKLGLFDGIQGFILCVFSASYVFTKYAKLWDYERNEKID